MVPGKTGESEIRKSFDTGIAIATKSGFKQDAAIANELCGEYHVRKGDAFWAKTYLSRAYELYQLWGADTKLSQLLKRRQPYIEETTRRTSSSRRSSTLVRASRASRSSFDSNFKRLNSLDDDDGHVTRSSSISLVSIPETVKHADASNTNTTVTDTSRSLSIVSKSSGARPSYI